MIQKHTSIQTSLNRALSFVLKQQQADGSFLTYRQEKDQHTRTFFPLPTTFTTSSIALALSSNNSPLSLEIEKKSIRFLLTQKSRTWTWNYWKQPSKEYTTTPYPDDLDDTCLALSALFLYDQSILKGSVLNHTLSSLVSCETKVGGPYTTWIVPKKAPKAWKDVDIVVNANIGYFLSLCDVRLPNLTTYYEHALHTPSLTSPYYISEYPALYALSRVVQGDAQKKLIRILEKKQHANGTWGTPLHTALAITSLCNLHASASHMKQALSFLIRTQQNDGSWEWEPYYVDAGRKKQGVHPVGSETLTTAFVCESFLCLETAQKTTVSYSSKSHQHTLLATRIQQTVINDISKWSQDGYLLCKPILNTLMTHDMAQQLVLLPYLFWQTIDKRYTKHIKNPDTFLTTLGEATLYGWIAYTIFDNVLDNEPNPHHISTALYAHRRMGFLFTHAIEQQTSLSLQKRITRQKLFNTVFTTTMNTLDAANQWEVTHARITPQTTQKDISIHMYRELPINMYNDIDKTLLAPSIADRSLGHALGPVAICIALGIHPQDKNIKHLFTVFRCYLSARQLNDDAHDWEEDLKKGQINAVGSYILSTYHSTHPQNKQTIKTLLSSNKLKEHFWDTAIPFVSQTIEQLCKKGIKTAHTLPYITKNELFESLFYTQMMAAKEAKLEQQKITEFLKHMSP